MATLYLIRHAEPDALWGAHPDPGLSVLGHEQARAAARELSSLNVLTLITSPLARCRETAAPLEAALGRNAIVNRAVAEIPVPTSVTEHRPWLSAIMTGNWSDAHVDPTLRVWRSQIGATLLALPEDTIIFSHFVAINAAVGFASGADQVTSFQPGHASMTVLSNDGGNLAIVALGAQSAIRLA